MGDKESCFKLNLVDSGVIRLLYANTMVGCVAECVLLNCNSSSWPCLSPGEIRGSRGVGTIKVT